MSRAEVVAEAWEKRRKRIPRIAVSVLLIEVAKGHGAFSQWHLQLLEHSGEKRVVPVVHNDEAGVDRAAGIRAFLDTQGPGMSAHIIIFLEKVDLVLTGE